MKTRSTLLAVLAIAAVLLALPACHDQKAKTAGKAAAKEQAAVANSFTRLQGSQQVPTFDYSQVRQTLIDVESAQADGAISTSAFFLEGIGLVGWCPSIGSPVASTSQLSASKQWANLPGDRTDSWKEIDQGEPTGVYPGNSSGTYTMCVDDQGHKWPHYWEGYVASDFGVINSYPPKLRVKLDQATYKFTTKGR